jgi:hypothetical protein
MREQRDRWQAERLAALAHYLATINVEGDFVCFEKPKSRL